ncbi:FliI/YscN family ATPase [Arenimonas terrae]|uniref:protein-secreting ATPase n=1 Tax=Arenimonas terrae TaxID=2546226 RepID=A0A5C4RPP7_9GAMM|nr:FliI/YscN family ATPase [Arenimonas terrae]TNJ33233.1 FliI/YscN family ATPase [Arenimonas terrae]
MNPLRARLLDGIARTTIGREVGRVTSYNGLVIESIGPDARLGELCDIEARDPAANRFRAEVVGFRNGRLLLMPYAQVGGLSPGSIVSATGRQGEVPVGDQLLGRVVDAFCRPLDSGPPLELDRAYPLHRAPINPMRRVAINRVLETGVRAVDTLLTLGEGQRMGVMAGSGVGKSTLLGMLARSVSTDVTVLALIGERGREVGDFIVNSLGAGLSKSVVLVAPADEPALVRTRAAHAAHAVAEYYRDQGKSVLLIVDSMTRFAMAQREVGLAVGEPPTFRGYTPSVFAWLPTMLERCGRFNTGGSITGIYSVLVEGDDMNEPVTDHMRAILDGHIVLDRSLAARGHHPAIDVLHSTSRLMAQIATPEEAALAGEARRRMAIYESSRDLIEMGAHQRGVNEALDRAIEGRPALERVLQQAPALSVPRAKALIELSNALSHGEGA